MNDPSGLRSFLELNRRVLGFRKKLKKLFLELIEKDDSNLCADRLLAESQKLCHSLYCTCFLRRDLLLSWNWRVFV